MYQSLSCEPLVVVIVCISVSSLLCNTFATGVELSFWCFRRPLSVLKCLFEVPNVPDVKFLPLLGVSQRWKMDLSSDDFGATYPIYINLTSPTVKFSGTQSK